MADIVSKAKVVTSPDVYSDLNLLFTAHPITKDVTRLLDADAVKRSVKNIVTSLVIGCAVNNRFKSE
jgi:hypothetical protein